MVKIKIFTRLSIGKEDIEKEVNDFIRDKKVIDIKPSLVVDSNDGCSEYKILVIYEE